MATKLEGGGDKTLVARPLVEELFFCGFPNKQALDLIFLKSHYI